MSERTAVIQKGKIVQLVADFIFESKAFVGNAGDYGEFGDGGVLAGVSAGCLLLRFYLILG